MIWEYCEDCYINGHCENQDRGYKCDVCAKRITDKCERLQKQLDIALSSMRDSRELLYQLSQILAADAIGKQLQEIKDLEKC